MRPTERSADETSVLCRQEGQGTARGQRPAARQGEGDIDITHRGSINSLPKARYLGITRLIDRGI